MSDQVVFRKGELVYLRPFNKADVPALQVWMNDQDVTQYLMNVFPITESDENEWVEKQGKDRNNVVLAIVTVEGDKLIGSIGLHAISWTSRTATTGTFIGDKECRGKGYGTEAKMLLLECAFNTFDLYAVLSRVMAHNAPSLAYANKCGYEEIGRIPEWIRRQNGERCDEVLLIVTQEKWRPLWQKYLEAKTSKK